MHCRQKLCYLLADERSVRLVLTLATPHQRSPAHVQPALAGFYSRLAWAPVPHVPVISIAGGGADVQVRDRLKECDSLCDSMF